MRKTEGQRIAKSTRVGAPLSWMPSALSFGATTNMRSDAMPPFPANHSLTISARRLAKRAQRLVVHAVAREQQ